MASTTQLRYAVKQLYRNLIHLGKDYPKGEEYFRTRCHSAFMKNKDVNDVEKIEELIARGEYVCKELEALYMLRKYRTLKKRYYDSHHVQ
ncbi:LYR motif-containing protein 5A-like [Antedon mediterranea]|uniref:LYR motif-containing protein 5A-like n=1 Tax=Antedon mediterranea TaxID=105859 RepID=UPI003AF64C24